jgi:hypothetical protein
LQRSSPVKSLVSLELGGGGVYRGGVTERPDAGTVRSRPDARFLIRGGAWLLGGPFAVGLAFGASRAAERLLAIAPFLALVFAAAMALAATRVRRRAEVLVSCPRSAIDGAVEELQSSGRPLVGVFSGRIGAHVPVTSPSGAVCAFYGATVRKVGGPHGKGAIVSQQRAAGPLLWIRGERAHAALVFSPNQVFAREEVRPGVVCEQLELDDGAIGVMSHERAVRIGENCFVLGRLGRGDAPGSCVIRGVGGGPATILIDISHAALGREWMFRSWLYYAGAAVLTCAAAWLLAR